MNLHRLWAMRYDEFIKYSVFPIFRISGQSHQKPQNWTYIKMAVEAIEPNKKYS